MTEKWRIEHRTQLDNPNLVDGHDYDPVDRVAELTDALQDIIFMDEPGVPYVERASGMSDMANRARRALCTCTTHDGDSGWNGNTPQDPVFEWDPECPIHRRDPNHE